MKLVKAIGPTVNGLIMALNNTPYPVLGPGYGEPDGEPADVSFDVVVDIKASFENDAGPSTPSGSPPSLISGVGSAPSNFAHFALVALSDQDWMMVPGGTGGTGGGAMVGDTL